MPEASPPPNPSKPSAEQQLDLDHLRELIRRAAELLPAQGPITAFVFLNTLQALETMPFEDGVRKGARLFGCQPYLLESQYRDKLTHDRIRLVDLATVLREDLGERADEVIGSLATRFELRLAMLEHTLRKGPPEELRWFVAETDALTRFRDEAPSTMRERILEETRHWVMRDIHDGHHHAPHGHAGRHHARQQQGAAPHEEREYDPESHRHVGKDRGARHLLADLLERYGETSIEQWPRETWEALALQALWRICREGAHACGSTGLPTPPPFRLRDALFDATSDDSDLLVHELLIRFCAAFTDQGFAYWQMPDRDRGFFQAFRAIYDQPGGSPEAWLAGLSAEFKRIEAAGLGPEESILESLQLLGLPHSKWDDKIAATLLALRGWAGMLWQMEVRGDRVARGAPAGTLAEFLAVRLILERFALKHLARQSLGFDAPLGELRDFLRAHGARRRVTSLEQRALVVFQVAQVLGWSPRRLHHLSRNQWQALVTEMEAFWSMERRRVFQLAFERTYRERALDAFSVHCARAPRRVEQPRFQAMFCIDAREESFRRHLEETVPDAETFGAAGFYCVPIYYRGVSDANYQALCPIVVHPKHWVVEEVVYSLEEMNRRRERARRAVGKTTLNIHNRSRGIAGGAVLAGLGVLASVPLLARVLFPRLTARLRRTAGQWMEPPPVTRLVIERTAAESGPTGDGIGFSVDEMANIAERMLRDTGLIDHFAPLVMIFGHGSYCLNNPHESAYHCGACSGSAGGPNARALALMFNDPRVRKILAQRGLAVPEGTFFLGGLHNTCNDTITFYDLDRLPKTHHRVFEAAQDSLAEVCQRNAHERCRRFDSASFDLTPEEAHWHVEGRSEDLAQTRPEFGNASVAIAFAGRRERVRGLYMDRRAFLHSYDPTQDDDESSILGRILAPLAPVCSGISLQYYFSYVDSTGWGAGTKLPHNVTSLLGVMDGHASDLRSGLPWQGVEIHEPLRLLFILETTPERIEKIMDRNSIVGNIFRNGWVQLILLDPESNQLRIYRQGEYELYQPHTAELPQVNSSIEWYRGWRDHLGFAQIAPEAAG
ncbi:MAG: DUF2309 domain-containing protein [Planctomycetes bacterium]|nr:DUF2309 domain-containing protein [Planctomycetota bacterium]